MPDKELRERGLAIRKTLWPDREGGIANFRALDPGYADTILETAYGGVYGDPTIDLRTRSLLTCAVLTALGHTRGLEGHLRGALNIGITSAELIAIFKQVALYAGYPVANDAFRILKGLLDEREAAKKE
ncbi:MAG: carboxymuconolactone decarboxylase family protein [Armatimonadetes bacterium]|nr:carboxymuconolactone decarboxylase family protein [Armatimonadota bacterium]